ncbi:hypothetical protein DXH95_07845 [Sphingorhabdus pulchriflava]|uniref:Uncharacterized protein n=1 Tax=Sphingorhabdus pulchriflava TaxID=2292257 RepID=A0A371BI59_9SPHN|nr:hypothetical protein [Sphingorhabdus pulchriflava]RDV07266.1 hypothetical protein DXH95_07845 [Sphingorhabdus pulchriflava]
MRTTLISAVLLASIAIGATAAAQLDPRGRFERNVPIAKPKPQNAASTGPIQDQGVHNAVHAAHQNQIVFTRTDLGIGAISEGDIVSDFTLGQPMFFRVFTERSAVNAIAAANNMGAREVYADGVHYTARFTINGQVFDTTIFPWGGRRDHETWTTWRGQFVNSMNAQRTPGSDAFLEMLSKATAAGLLKPGKHSIKMEVIAKTNTEKAGPISAGTVASGTFNLIVPAGVFQASNPHVCGPVRGAAGSAAVETRALAHAKQFWDWPDLTPVKAVGVGNAWTIEKNELTSIPIERYTDVAIVARGAKYCTSHVHKFTQEYAGGGTYAQGGISVNFTPGFVPCACLG